MIKEPLSERLRARWQVPRSFTAILPLETGQSTELGERLRAIAPRMYERLGAVDDLHFLRILVIPPNSRTRSGCRILINSVHDGPLAQHLNCLGDALGSMLVECLRGSGFVTEAPNVAAAFLRHRVREKTFFIAALGMTVRRIQQEKRLREALASAIDRREQESGSADEVPAEVLRLELQAHARTHLNDSSFPQTGAPPRSFGNRILQHIDLILTFLMFPIIGVLATDMFLAIRRIKNRLLRFLTGIACALWWLYGGIFTAVAFLGVRFVELMEPDIKAPLPGIDRLLTFEAVEDCQPRNCLSVWFPVRESWIGRLLMRVILFGSDRGARHFWTYGRLAGAQNIHYARLLQVDDGRTMVFMSDYEGSFNGYIDHFVGIGGSPRAVVPISSRLDECPKTRWMYHQVDPPSFRRRWRDLIRLYQLPAPIWYSAYPQLSANDVLANARIREGLFAEHLSESAAQDWTREF